MSSASGDSGRVNSQSDSAELTDSENSESDAYFEVEGESDQLVGHASVSPVDGEQEVMIALPPKEREGIDYHTIALSGSSAQDILEQLVASNTIGKERASRLRMKYNTLQETLESSRLLESTLLDRVKTLEHQFNYQRKVLDKGAAFPEGDSTVCLKLRQTLLTQQNELDMSNARHDTLQQEIEQMELDHVLVEKEYAGQPKKEELDQFSKEMEKAIDELKDEIFLHSEDAQRCQHELDKKKDRMVDINQEKEELDNMQEILQQKLMNLCNDSILPKEVEVNNRCHKEAQDKIGKSDKHLNELTSFLSEAQKREDALRMKSKTMSMELREKRNRMIQLEVELERLNKDIMMCKEREATLLEDKATLELRQKHRQAEYKSLFITQSSKIKEKDKELKALKKADLQFSVLKQSKQQVSLQLANVEEKRTEIQQDYDKFLASKEVVTKDVTTLRKGTKMINGMTEAEHVQLDNLVTLDAQTKKIAKQLQSRVQELNKSIMIMIKTRDHETLLYYRALREDNAIKDNLRVKETLINDQQKRILQVDKEFKDFAIAYAVVKAEENKVQSQTFLMQQVHAELTEKNKILTNEIEILHNTANEKDKILQKCYVVYNVMVAERDSQHQELGRVRMSQVELNDHLEQQRAVIAKFIHEITLAEEDLSKLRKMYQKSAQDRNDLGLQLIERNEEVTVFYEKANLQESIITKANIQFEAREEEIKILNLEVNKIKNEILIYRKHLLGKNRLDIELKNATKELKICEVKMRRLHNEVEDSSNPRRLRLLPGDDPTCNDLDWKLNKVKVQLSLCERQHLEKELLFEQVCKLTERANKKVETRRFSTLAVAKKVNHYQSRIKDTTRKMMALVSELSMQQALSLHLMQEVSERESRVQQANMRLANGEVPDEEIHNEWERMMLVEQRREEAKIEKDRLEKDERSHLLPEGTITTAELRPNAYIPSEKEDLPLPRPFGSCAPFKPTLPGGAMRHIRKPEPQTIDI